LITLPLHINAEETLLQNALKGPALFRLLPFLVLICILVSGCQGEPFTGTAVLEGADFDNPEISEAVFSQPGPDDSIFKPPPEDIKFGKSSVNQGLSQSSVSSILQDGSGLMWFGTDDGLNKFDGYEFSIYKHDPENANSISSNVIQTLFEDSKGQLWIGTTEGLDRYNRASNEWHHFPLDQVRAIIEDSSGVLWVASFAGLFRYEGGENPGLVRHMSESTYALVEDSEGFIWVGTDRGLMQLDESRESTALFQHRPSDDDSLIDNFVRVIHEDSDGLLWVGTLGGLDKFDSSSGIFTHFVHDDVDIFSLSDNVVRTIYEDRSGVTWVGTDFGLNRYDPDVQGFLHYNFDADDPDSLSSDQIRAISQDRGGVIWIGTNAAGLNTFDVTQKSFVHHEYEGSGRNRLSNNLVFSLFEDDSEILWVGTGGGGINRFDRSMDVYTYYQHEPKNPDSLSDDYVTSVFVDMEGVLWAGTANGGLNKLDRFTGKFTHYRHDPDDIGSIANDSVWVLMKDRLGELWIGTQGGGLDSFDRLTEKFVHHEGLSSDLVNAIYEDQEGLIWIGTSTGGLNMYDRKDETFTHFVHDPYDPDSISSDYILSILQDSKELYWIGTAGAGLNKFDPESGIFRHFREKDGLPSDVVYGILEDDQGMLWISTNSGLSMFDPGTELFRNYDVRDGLQSNEFNQNAYFKNTEGEMFFGGVNGFNTFYPEEIEDDGYISPVVLTSLTQSGGDVFHENAADTIKAATFRWPNNFFEFEFATLSYSQPEKNQHAYMLEGFRDEQWNYIGTKRFGRYTNLPGGTYTLHIKGSNKDGVWNETGSSIQITVIPPIWMTWWFQTIAILLIVGGVFAGYWMRIRNIQSRTVELEDQVSDRTKELATLNSIAAVVSSSLDLQKILKDALEETLELMKIEAGGVYLVQDSDETLTIEAYQGLSEAFVSEIDDLQAGEGFSGSLMKSGEILVIQDVSLDSRLSRSIVKDAGFQALIVIPLISRGQILGTLFLLTHEDRDYIDEDLKLLSAIGAQIGGAIENAKFFEEEHLRSEQFRVLAEVGRRVSTILDVNEVLEEVVRLIHNSFGYYHVAIGLIEGDDVVYRVGSGELWDNENFQFKPARLRVGREGLSGWVAATGKPLVIPDVSKEPRYVWMRGSQTRSEVTVPILVKGKVIGVLDTQSDKVNDFDETDLAVLQSLAHQAGSAIENARLYEQAQQAAVLEERARLARDLHDAVTQTLFSASLLAEALPASWESDHQEGEKLLDEIKNLNRGALAEMRTLLIELRPSALIEANFGDLLQQLAEAASGREGLPVEVEVECACTLPPDVHIALYRITQEALNNVVKHARAGQVNVSVSCSHCSADKFGEDRPREITLLISDDGQGFNLNQNQHDKLGLGIMRERAVDIGAQIEIDSEPGAGTRITVQWQDSKQGDGG